MRAKNDVINQDELTDILKNSESLGTSHILDLSDYMIENDKNQSLPHWLQYLQAEKEMVLTLNFWRACMAEFVGTMLLCVYAIGVTLYPEGYEQPSTLHTALGTGFFIFTLISALVNCSGAHVNPAVSVGLVMSGHATWTRAFVYIIFQCTGAVSGSFLVYALWPSHMVGSLGLIQPGLGATDMQALFMEILVTGYLGFGIAAVLDKDRTDLHGFIPLCVALIVFSNIMLVGSVSGACMNPARALGPAIVMGNYSKQWIYWTGPFVGAILGFLIYHKCLAVTISLPRCCPSTKDKFKDSARQHETQLEMELQIEVSANAGRN